MKRLYAPFLPLSLTSSLRQMYEYISLYLCCWNCSYWLKRYEYDPLQTLEVEMSEPGDMHLYGQGQSGGQQKWPWAGSVSFRNLIMRYPSSAIPVLRYITLLSHFYSTQ
jgi:hypothetical protein